MNRPLVRYMLGLIVLLSLAACGVPDQPTAQSSAAPQSTATTTSSAGVKPKIAANATVLTIRREGGMCQYGSCWFEQRISPDGSYQVTDGTSTQKAGTLDPTSTAQLVQLIAEANFDEIRAQPFEGTCPIAFDGQEVIYTFQTMSGPQTVASCQVAIDAQSPLFAHIATLVEQIDQAQG